MSELWILADLRDASLLSKQSSNSYATKGH